MITSSVRPLGGVPTLFVDNAPQPGLAYITYLQERHRYADFAAAGYRLFSFTAYFGDQGINAVTGIHAFSPGIFDQEGQADYSRFDATVDGVPCVGLNKVRMPGNLVAVDIEERGRGWSILAEWPERRPR